MNEAEEALERTRGEAAEMAEELVNQYNRFQLENQELRNQLEQAHKQSLEQQQAKHDQEKQELLDEFEERAQKMAQDEGNYPVYISFTEKTPSKGL